MHIQRVFFYWLVGIFLLWVSSSVQAQTLTFTNENEYITALTTIGFDSFREGFEDVGTWGGVRSPSSTPSVTSQGVVWSANHTGNDISTSIGAAITGDWGVYDPDHGMAVGTAMQCDGDTPPADCFFHDGVSGSRVGGLRAFSGVGVWFSGTVGAKVTIILDQVRQIELGQLSSSGGQFFGIIDTDGFNAFQLRETEGKVGDQLFLFGDDFTIGLYSSVLSCIPSNVEDVTCDGVDDDCNGFVDDGFVSDDSCGVGVCQTDNIPSSCRNGIETACRPGIPRSEDTETTCTDGLDNNCNGLVDAADRGCGGAGPFSWSMYLPAILGYPQ